MPRTARKCPGGTPAKLSVVALSAVSRTSAVAPLVAPASMR
jgi:hypothetical protein